MSSPNLPLILSQVQMLVTHVVPALVVCDAACVISYTLQHTVLLLDNDAALPYFGNLLICSHFDWLDVLKFSLLRHSLRVCSFGNWHQKQVVS